MNIAIIHRLTPTDGSGYQIIIWEINRILSYLRMIRMRKNRWWFACSTWLNSRFSIAIEEAIACLGHTILMNHRIKRRSSRNCITKALRSKLFSFFLRKWLARLSFCIRINRKSINKQSDPLFIYLRWTSWLLFRSLGITLLLDFFKSYWW